MKRWVASTNVRDHTLVGIASGANMDFDRLRFVSERADSSETMLSVLIPETPGAFRRLISCIEPRNVTEFSYRMGRDDAAAVYLSFQARGATADARADDATSVLTALRADGNTVSDLRDNELAKAHLRHLGGACSRDHHTATTWHVAITPTHPRDVPCLAGGRKDVPNERLIRFEFPERPGALSHFLDALDAVGWNVSLFQYRNHGADIGRVLAGVQVPPEQTELMSSFLDEVGYRYELEDENELRQHFL
jgi:threonine dehydratase